MPFPRNKAFAKLIQKAEVQHRKNLPFVLYRKPKAVTVTGIFQHSDTLFSTDDFSAKGFVFAPFEVKSLKTILLKADDIEETEYTAHQEIDIAQKKPSKEGKQPYAQLLQKAKDGIAKGVFEKVVLSRKVVFDTNKSPFDVFEAALSAYQNAFCYLWYHPNVGLWLGASPETLLGIQNDCVTTISLAGTMKANGDKLPEWSHKERHEQQLVTDFISASFKKHLENIHVTDSESVRAGNLWHLKSKIIGRKGTDFSLNRLLDAVHPTPAVCGFPQHESLAFILENEGYQREYYTGFLGELNLRNDGETHLFVNLRCLRLNADKASIYVGGGITAQSNIDNEWSETQNKSLTMLQLL